MPTKNASALQAARMILEQAAEPLHYGEITKRILAQGLWHTTGKTPDETVNARLAVDIKSKGTTSLFIRPSPGHYALNPNPAIRPPSSVLMPPSSASSPAPLPTADCLLPAASKSISFTDAAERVHDTRSFTFERRSGRA